MGVAHHNRPKREIDIKRLTYYAKYSDELTNEQLAKMFRVSESFVQRIKAGESSAKENKNH